MHYLVFVFVKEPTEEAVKAAMADHENEHWDWYRCGGRWDGYLLGDEEMKRRETRDGFNLDSKNESIERNCCKVSDLSPDKKPHSFVSEHNFIPGEYYHEYEPNSRGKYYGTILPTPDFEKRYADALAKHAGDWVVVVDVHN